MFQFANSCIEIPSRTNTTLQTVVYISIAANEHVPKTGMKNKIDIVIIRSFSSEGKKGHPDTMFSIKLMGYDLYLFQRFFVRYRKCQYKVSDGHLPRKTTTAQTYSYNLNRDQVFFYHTFIRQFPAIISIYCMILILIRYHFNFYFLNKLRINSL